MKIFRKTKCRVGRLALYAVWSLVFGLWCFAAPAATYYCSPAGGGSGADCNNLMTFPSNGGTRGNTYVYTEGNYGGVVFSAANSGSTTVTWRKLNSSDSGVAGYLSTMHDGVAAFGGINIARQYLVWEGGARTNDDNNEVRKIDFEAITLAATVTSEVVTNVVSGNNEQGCSTCEMMRGNITIALHHPFHNAPAYQPATEQWTITNIVKRTTLKTAWRDEWLTFTKEETLSSVTNRLKLVSEWKAQ